MRILIIEDENIADAMQNGADGLHRTAVCALACHQQLADVKLRNDIAYEVVDAYEPARATARIGQ